MFELEGTAPDAVDADDPAVRRLPHPQRVWIDLAGLWDTRPARALSRTKRPAGVAATGLVRGVLYAWITTRDGWWLGAVGLELHRDDSPVLTTWALVPEWALRRRVPGRDRQLDGKASNRPTLAQQARERQQRPAAP